MAGGGRRDGAGRPKGALQATTAEDYRAAQGELREVSVETWRDTSRKKRGPAPPKEPHAASMRWWVRGATYIRWKAMDAGDYRTAAKMHELIGDRCFGRVRWQVEHGGLEGGAPIRTELVAAGLYQTEFADGTIAMPAGAVLTAAAAPTDGGGQARAPVRARPRKGKANVGRRRAPRARRR